MKDRRERVEEDVLKRKSCRGRFEGGKIEDQWLKGSYSRGIGLKRWG
jgi:hypothetical protein